MKKLFSNKSAGKYISLAVAVYTLCCLIYYLTYSVKYDYFDATALALCLIGIASATCYFFLDFDLKLLEYLTAALTVVSVACISVTFAIIVKNSIYVWADELNGIKMFGSRGGLAPVITLIALFVIAIAAQITACFLGNKKNKNQNNKEI